MSYSKIKIFAPNIITVCINGSNNCDFYGEIWNQYSPNPSEFSSIMNLIFMMEELYDKWNFPQRSTNCRSFLRWGNEPDRTPNKSNIRRDKKMDINNVQEKRGKQGTFIVQVQYRQNSSWQGQVIWAEGNRCEHFRSALELMKLIDGAMDEAERNNTEESAS